MVVYELYSDTLTRAYSDQGFYIHGGFPEADYAQAIDPTSLHRTYIETDIPVPPEELEPPEQPEFEII